jgi:hypothetical protein
MDDQTQLQYQLTHQATIYHKDSFVEIPEHIVQRRQQLVAAVTKESDAACAMEAIASSMRRWGERGELTRPVMAMASVALESIALQAGTQYRPANFSLESHLPGKQQDFKLTLESIGETVSKLYESVKKNIADIGEHLVQTLGHFHRQCQRLKNKAVELESMSKKRSSQKPAYPAIKAEAWCKYLCHTEFGFDHGLKTVLGEVGEFIKAHEKMSSRCIDKYVKWLKNNGASGDDAIESLDIDPDDFTLPGMTHFARSVVMHEPKPGNLFYRTKELPGGYALYVETASQALKGSEALDALHNTRYIFEIYNPASYNTLTYKLRAVASVSVAIWLGAINPLLGLGAAVVGAIHNSSQKHEGTGHELDIDKDMLFQVLTREEIDHVIRETSTAVVSIERWYSTVLQRPWKSHDLDNSIKTLTNNEATGTQIKAYCSALLHLISNISTGVESYAFNFYHACLLFAEKSLKQYV